MNRLLRWTGIVVGVIVLLLLMAAGAIYAISERALERTFPIPKLALSLPTDAAAIEDGRRQAVIRSCINGCHGKDGEGAVMFDKPVIARVVAPNLPSAARRYDANQLGAIIRHGVRPDGHSMIVMPSEQFVALDDEDLAKIVAFLRSMPPSTGPDKATAFGPAGRLGLAIGKFKTVAQVIAESTPPPQSANDPDGRGRYLARSVCGGCHGPELKGSETPAFVAPDLSIVAGYTAPAFETLIKTGIAPGGRELRTMTREARNNLSAMTSDEIAALYGYLRALPEARIAEAGRMR